MSQFAQNVLNPEELQMIINQAPSLIWRANTETFRNYFSPAWLNFTGRTLEQELGKGWMKSIHPDDTEGYLKTYLDYSQSYLPFEVEYRLKRQDGEYRWMLDKATPYFDTNGKFEGYIGSCCDFTKQKLAEEELRKNTERLNESQRIAKMGDFTWKLETGDVIWSKGMHDLLGYDEAEEIDYTKVNTEIHHPDDLERITNWLNECIESGESYHSPNEYRLIQKNGKILTVQTSLFVRYQMGKAIEVIGTCFDITKLKKTDDALKASEMRYQSIISAASEGIVLQDTTGLILTANKQAEQILGLSIDQMSGRTSLDPRWHAIHQDGSPFPGETHPAMVTLSDGKPRQGVIMGIHKPNGLLTWISINTKPLFHEGKNLPYAVVASFTDITEQKEAEEELIQSENQLFKAKEKAERIAFELKEAQKVASIGSWYLDSTTNEVTWNDELSNMYGYELDAQVPSYPEFENLSTPDSWKKLTQTIDNSLTTGVPYELEMEFLRKDGSKGWMWAKGEPVFDDNKNIIGLRGVSQDITERKKLNLELKQKKFNLERAQSIGKMGSWKWDIKANQLYWSDEYYNIIGVSPEAFEANYEAYIKFIHPDDLEHFKSYTQKALENKESWDIEYRIIRPDNEVRIVHEIGEVVIDNNGNPTSFFGINQDITERKQMELELIEANQKTQESEEILKKIAENFPNSYVSIVEKDLTASFVSGAEITNQGLNSEDYIGVKIEDIFGDYAQHIIDIYQKTFEGEETRNELQFDNQYLLYKTVPLVDDKGYISKVLVVSENITEQKERELELEKAKIEAEKREFELIESQKIAKIGSWNFDFFTHEVIWSEELYRMYGFDPTKPVPNYSNFENLYAPDSWQTLSKTVENTIKTGLPYELELEIIKKDGSKGWLWAKGVPIFDKNKQVIALRGIAQDITERKETEDNLIHQFQIQQLLIQLASSFINIPLSEVPKSINQALANLGNFFNIDRAYIFDYNWEKNIAINTYEWCNIGINPEIDNLQEVPLESIPQWAETHKKGQKMIILDTYADSVAQELKDLLIPQGIKSLITAPMLLGEECIGFLGFDSVREKRMYSATEEEILFVLSQMLVNITEHKITQENLKQQFQIQQILMELASEFINVSLDEVSNTINHALANIGNFFSVDRAYIIEYDWQNKVANKTYEWCAKGISSEIDNTQNIPFEVVRKWIKFHQKGENSTISNTSAIEGEDGFKEMLQAQGIKSIVTVPMMVAEHCIGCVGFDSVREHREYTKTEEDLLLIFAQMIVNVIERKQTEQELINSEANLLSAKKQVEENEKRLLLASQSAQLGIYDWNITDNILIWDDRMYALFGYDKDTTKTPLEISTHAAHPDDKERFQDALRAAFKGQEDFDISFRIVHPNGKVLHIRANGLIIRDEKGKPKRMIGINRDITESKNREALLESKNRQLVDFSNIVAHNLRGPLVNIEMLINLVEESNDIEEQKLFISKLKPVILHLNEVFNELIESIQVRQDVDIQSEKIILKEHITKVLTGFESQIESFQAEVKVDFNTAPFIHYPKKYIDSIFSNLVSNALKYKSPDRKPYIHIKTKKINDAILLSVSDNGLGIDMSLAKDKLFKIRKTFHNHPEAKGFGLFMTKTQIETMGDEIWVESTPHQGSTFYIKFKNQK